MTCSPLLKDGLTEFKKMKHIGRKKGFTLVELMTVMGILALLASALLTAGKYVKIRAYERLTASTISVIVTALEQYYDDIGGFPAVDHNITLNVSAFKTYSSGTYNNIEDLTGGTVSPAGSGVMPEYDEYASIAAMYYYLNRCFNSSNILSAISDTFITGKDKAGTDLALTVNAKTVPLIRIVDTWGNALRYKYTSGDSFPVIVSAGRDGDFSTTGDNISSSDL